MIVNIPSTLNPSLYDHPDEIAYITSAIINRYHFDRRYSYGDAVPLQMSVLRQVLGRKNAKPALDEALNCWVISTNGSYVPTKSSKRYALAPSLCNDRLVPYEITDTKFNKRIKKYRLGRELRNRENYKDIHYKLEEDLKLIEIDDLDESNLLCYTRDGSIEQLNGNIDSYNKIKNGDWIHTVCDNGRFHTNLTNCARNLRKHISVDGKRLVWADINCSQPFFLALCIKSYISHLYSSTSNQQRTTNQPTNQVLPPYDGRIEIELNQFIKEVESGAFYHICANRMGVTKDDVKTNLIQVLFDRPRTKCKWTQYYIDNYPLLYEVICSLKSDGYADLARYLQETEAQIIFEACALIKEEHPDLPCYTIHDAIGVPEGKLDIVVSAMTRIFDKYEVTPSIDTGDNMFITGDLVIVDGKENEIGEMLYSNGESWVVSYPDGCTTHHLVNISHSQSEADRRIRRYERRLSTKPFNRRFASP